MGGGLADDVKRLSPPLDLWRSFVYCESLFGNVFGTVDHFKGRKSAHDPAVSPEPVAHLSQHRVAALLHRHAQTPHNAVFMGWAASNVQLRPDVSPGHNASMMQGRANSAGTSDVFPRNHMHGSGGSTGVAWDYDAGGLPRQPAAVTVDVRGWGRMQRIGCEFLVLADGANSRLRDELGIEMDGDRAIQSLMNVHFSSPQLARRLRTARPAMLYFVFNAQVIMVIVAHDLTTGEFVAQLPFFPPLQRAEDFTEEVCRALICSAAGEGGVPDAIIHSVRPWTMTAEVAAAMQLGGRVFLAGDAAHRFPPAGGFGQNTGIQDAHNLAWKLAAVLQGRAGAHLLESYEAERRPVAQANTALSVANYRESLEVPRLLGLDHRAAAALTAALTSPLAALLPSSVPGTLFRGGVQLGQRLAGVRGPLRTWRAAPLRRLFDSGATLRLQFPKEDIGFMYDVTAGRQGGTGGGAAGGAPAPQVATGWGAGRGTERDAPYVPTTALGARLPHAELTDAEGRTVSTLDLCCGAAPELVLVLAGGPDGDAWAAAAAILAEQGASLRICRIQPHIHDVDDKQHREGQRDRCASNGTRAEAVFTDSTGQWGRIREVGPGGAILVRPDGHVTWRCLQQSTSPGAAAAELEAAVAAALCLPAK